MTDLDAQDVLARLRVALADLAEWQAGGTGTIEDRLRLFALLKDAGGNFGLLAQAQREVGASITHDLDGPVVVDGRVWKPGRRLSKREADKAWVQAQVSRLALEPKLDPETGEKRPPEPAEILERVWTLAEPAMGRTAQFGKVGIDLDDAWAVKEWNDVLEEA